MIKTTKTRTKRHTNHDEPTALLRMVLLDPPEQQSKGYARGADVVCSMLPADQLGAVLSLTPVKARDLFIGGIVDLDSETLALVRGDRERLTAPLTIFQASGTTKPDFHRFTIDDYGQTIRFGDYEAGADFVLYAVDPEFRRRVNAERLGFAKGFGPSLRRLRILRKLGRDAFDGISAKTVARIERGEVRKPRGRTLSVICQTLDVKAADIETY